MKTNKTEPVRTSAQKYYSNPVLDFSVRSGVDLLFCCALYKSSSSLSNLVSHVWLVFFLINRKMRFGGQGGRVLLGNRLM